MKPFDYEDVQLIPRKCIVESRSECDTTVMFGNHQFKLPVVPANMQTILNEEIAEGLAQKGYFYIMHRFEPAKRLAFAKKMQAKHLIASISVGIKPEEYDFVDQLVQADVQPEYITIDVAHGHSDSVIKMIKYLKQRLPQSFVIAGNVGTPEAVVELEEAGADATKVGIGPGKVCITKIKTGFGTGGWQLAAVQQCAAAARKPIIADGGIRTNGDIAKSIKFGATMVMVGSLLAGQIDSPGQTKVEDGVVYKEYFGSASEFQKGEHKNVEGKKLWLPATNHLRETLNEMHEDLQSSISYAGGRNLDALRAVDFVIVKNTIFNGD